MPAELQRVQDVLRFRVGFLLILLRGRVTRLRETQESKEVRNNSPGIHQRIRAFAPFNGMAFAPVK